MNTEIKRHLISAAVTFTGTFLAILGANLMAVDPVSLDFATLAGLSVAAVRAAVKVAFEAYVAQTRK
jgi:hypothetical protein